MANMVTPPPKGLSHSDWQQEQNEWQDALDGLVKTYGEAYGAVLLQQLRQRLKHPAYLLNSRYENSITKDQDLPYPGDLILERHIENIHRYNAMAMVLQAYDSGTGVGGHIATYASLATLLEVGFNHFFRAKTAHYGGDRINVQAHGAPGIYARAFLEGRLSAQQLQHFRRELQPGGGLSSYPHPRQMPGFWQAPTASMGLSTPSTLYAARFAKYLEHRQLKPNNGGKFWTFIGDGEADEPEVIGSLAMAGREQLDNVIFVVNCNLQRLDGPVRGNGKIIQELESLFLGANWHVIKLIFSQDYDELFAKDEHGLLKARLAQLNDGEFQWQSVASGAEIRQQLCQGNEQLESLLSSLSDEQITQLRRGGHDPIKIYTAYHQAVHHQGKPCVILVKTVKGDQLLGTQGQNNAHQKKQMSHAERIAIGRHLDIPLSDEQLKKAEFYQPDKDSNILEYLHQRRQVLGGYLPQRTVQCDALSVPDTAFYQDFYQGSQGRSVSTTMVLVRLLAKLLRDKTIGPYIIPIVPDEARTFGMEGLFRSYGIYNSKGQLYTPVDQSTITPYKESKTGQILQEGICETGALASFIAAGTAYATHGVPTIPMYIYYSMFGFQRVGDMIWSASDMLTRGFLFGATSGRTTLNGEGLQHQDGHSHILASTYPSILSYDPAFGYELAVLVQTGLKRMLNNQENIIYYLTIGNQNQIMPPINANHPNIIEGIQKGMYRYAVFNPSGDNASKKKNPAAVHLLGSGAIMVEVLQAAEKLMAMDFCVTVWSVTSYNQLTRDAIQQQRTNMLENTQKPCYLETLLKDERGIFVSASDYQKSLSLGIAPWLPGRFMALGTDGFGVSESRADLREHFEVSADFIILACLTLLKQENTISEKQFNDAQQQLTIHCDKPDPAGYVF